MILKNPKFDKDYIFNGDSLNENSSLSMNLGKQRSLDKHPYLRQAYNPLDASFEFSRLINRNNRTVEPEKHQKWDIDEIIKQDHDLSTDSLWAKKDPRTVVNHRKKLKTSSRKLIRHQIRHDFTPLKDLHSQLISQMPNYAAKSRLKERLRKVGGTVLKTFRALEKLEDGIYKASTSEVQHDWHWGIKKRLDAQLIARSPVVSTQSRQKTASVRQQSYKSKTEN